MNIRDAILKAADHIERHPHEFVFSKTQVPECGTPGCALGWIGFYCELKGSFTVSCDLLGLRPEPLGGTEYDAHKEYQFYNRMTALDGSLYSWTNNSDRCARALRLYADKYHPARDVAKPFDFAAIINGDVVKDPAVSEELA